MFMRRKTLFKNYQTTLLSHILFISNVSNVSNTHFCSRDNIFDHMEQRFLDPKILNVS